MSTQRKREEGFEFVKFYFIKYSLQSIKLTLEDNNGILLLNYALTLIKSLF